MDNIISRIIEVLILVVILLFIKEVIHRVLNKYNEKRKLKNVTTLVKFLKRLVSVIIYFIIFVFILSQFKFFESLVIPLLSGAGLLAAIVGLAAQDTLSNIFCTLPLVFGSPFKIGDYIKCIENNISGEVEEITFRHTIIRTVNNKRLVIPNNKMNAMIIENYSFNDSKLCELVDYNISYESDLDKAIKILENEMNQLYNPNTKSKIKIEFPKIRVLTLDESSIKLRVWVWGKDVSNVFDNVYTLNKNVKNQFEKNNISIPYRHMNIIVENKNTRRKK